MASTHKTELPVLPHDTELALRELRWVCAKAERFRGEHGERRKVAVTTVTLTDDEDPYVKGKRKKKKSMIVECQAQKKICPETQ